MLAMPAAFCSSDSVSTPAIVEKINQRSHSDLSMSNSRALSADAAAATTITAVASAAMGHAGDPHLQHYYYYYYI